VHRTSPQEPVSPLRGGTDAWLTGGKSEYAAVRIGCEPRIMCDDVRKHS
jgi:hypothetical protein